MKIKDIERAIQKKIKKSKISEIINYFFYWDSFLIWLEKRKEKSNSALDGNFQTRWQFILEFEKGYTDEEPF